MLLSRRRPATPEGLHRDSHPAAVLALQPSRIPLHEHQVCTVLVLTARQNGLREAVRRHLYHLCAAGYEATRYELATDQFGTQLDPPAHWAPEYPGIDELPATFAVRPLAVISIVPQLANDPGYRLQVAGDMEIGRNGTDRSRPVQS